MSEQSITLNLADRTVTGKAVKSLRQAGLVPVVVYQGGKDSFSLQADAMELLKAYRHAGLNHPVSLQFGGKKHLAMIKNVDADPVKHAIRHVAFHAIRQNEKVTAEVPIRVQLNEGNEVTPAERAGLVVLATLDAVEVEALPRDLPDALTFNGEKLAEIGDHATLADLRLPEGVTLKAVEPTTTIASVYEPSALAAANESAGGDAEPEDVESVEAENGAEPGEAEANIANSINSDESLNVRKEPTNTK